MWVHKELNGPRVSQGHTTKLDDADLSGSLTVSGTSELTSANLSNGEAVDSTTSLKSSLGWLVYRIYIPMITEKATT